MSEFDRQIAAQPADDGEFKADRARTSYGQCTLLLRPVGDVTTLELGSGVVAMTYEPAK